MSPWRLRAIARQIDRGALIAYPTDTIWGFGCSPLSGQAVKRLQKLKQRAPNKGLILLSPELEYLKLYIDGSAFIQHKTQLNTVTNRPITWIIKSSNYCPGWLTGYTDKIAIRITQVPQIKILCDINQSPLVSTSANKSSRSPIRNSFQAHKHFHNSVDYIIEGFTTSSQQASEIRDIQTGEILRP